MIWLVLLGFVGTLIAILGLAWAIADLRRDVEELKS